MKKNGLFLLVVLIHLSAFSKKPPPEEIGSSWNYAYLYDFDGLFDQTEILESDRYKNTKSDEEKEQILEKHFLQKKMEAVLASLKVPGAFLVAVSAVLSAGYYFKIQQILPWPKINPIILASSSLSATLMGLSLFYSPIQNFSEWVTSIVSGTISSAYQYFSGNTFDALEKYERLYVRKKPKIKPGLQQSIEKQLRIARTGESDFSSTDEKTSAQFATQLISSVLSFPREIKEISYDRARFDAIFDCYNEDTKKELRRLVVGYVAKEQGQLEIQKHAVYFKGAPGTGKTRAAKLLAKFLQVPYQEISLSEISKTKFVGSRDKDIGPDPGLIANAMLKVGEEKESVQNFVMLIDEADRILNAHTSDKMNGLANYMLMYLDPNRNFYYNEFFKAEIDTSNMYTILAGNFEIKDEALRNRLLIIPFGAISPTCKRKIVWEEYFPQIFKKYEHSKFLLSKEDFTEEDRISFDKLIEQDIDPGMRTIYLKIESYLADIILEKLEKKI